MNCKYAEVCGGCAFINLDEKVYREQKYANFKKIISTCKQEAPLEEPIFIKDGTRRRAAFAFSYSKKKLTLGFNEKASKNLVDIDFCPLLTDKINQNLPLIRELISEICQNPLTEKLKKGKFKTTNINSGDILVCEADNGLDIVLEFDSNLSLEHRLIISEVSQKGNDIIRISHRKNNFDSGEIIAEKIKPYIEIAGIKVYISAGTFLQASKEGEKALLETATKYLENDEGKIADLFCGIGTFSYPLSRNINNKITAIDSSQELLEGFQNSINKNIIPNIEIIQKNLFKYPLYEDELKNFNIIILDPPRAGAYEQVQKIANVENIKKIIYVSCNPNSFVRDADVLCDSSYQIEKLTFVDQFTYSTHFELVALFTKKK
ncbi:MAG: class I SAM-dependent RNA methyltransferase [Alphaproteobacteria bacterium]